MTSLLRSVFTTAAFMLASSHGIAQPANQPIRMIVGLAPGGIADQAARIVAPKLGEVLGQQVVVENRTGAGGAIAAEYVAKAPGDGMVIMMGFDGTLVTAPAVQPKQPYNVLTDLRPISKIADSPLLITGAPNLKAKNLKDFLALAKTQPGKFDYGTAGVGSTGHLVGELLEARAGVFLVHIPYRGGGQALIDVVGGQIPLMLAAAAASQAHVKAGKAIGLATTGAKRLGILPDVPTVRESGVKGLEKFEAYSWVGLLGPKDMPPAVVNKYHEATIKALADPALRTRLEAIGAVPVGNTPAEFGAQIKADMERWTALVKSAGISAD
jgi:tripartite-type tricarboxylate transporter receptor subunit TctC